MAPDPIDQLSALTHQHLPNPMQDKDFLLAFLLDWDEAHGRPCHGLANCFRVCCIILVRLDVGANILRRQQTNIVAKPTEHSGPMMTSGASFDPDLTRRQLPEIRFNLVPLELSTENRPTMPVSSMNLENGFGDVQSDKCNWLSHLYPPCCRSAASACTNIWRLGERGHPCHHARRKLKEVFDRDGSEIAADGLRRIAEFYAVEADIRGVSPGQRLSARQARTAPLVADFGDWLQAQRRKISSKSRLGEKLTYIHNHWDGLQTFLHDGRVEIDSNRVENLIRPIALNRKNALFAGHDEGGVAWGRIASLIETCKINGIEPFAYLKITLTALANGHPQSRLDELLPWNFTPSR